MQWVCCSSGTLPSKRPNQNPDGSCFSVPVVDGSFCNEWEKKYDVTEAEINTWNSNTWRWTGCTSLQIGQSVCMSAGSAPLPAQNASIPCGGEAIPRNKECPLNGCCGKYVTGNVYLLVLLSC
jgi:chitinase